uniref:Uncharacterized protein n=1 Tax=Anguilla anguilla TaxID=7936 RepID=A0A0E9PZ57_ANGAN
MVCEALISSDSVEWERRQLWALTFQLIRKIIGGVDYKVSQAVRLVRKIGQPGHKCKRQAVWVLGMEIRGCRNIIKILVKMQLD